MLYNRNMKIDSSKLKPCPFCGRKVDDDLIDTLYPSGIYWRQHNNFRSYHSHKERKEGDQPCYEMNCTESNGGCGAEISADTLEEVITKWNRRPEDKPEYPLAVCVLAFRHEQAIVVSRRNNPSSWGILGGKVDPGETPIEAAIRESYEEARFFVNAEDLVELYTAVCPGEVTYNVITYLYTKEAPRYEYLVAEPGLTLYYAPLVKLTNPAISPFAEYNKGVLDAYRKL